ncbi:MAG: Arsenical resistance operon repressor [Candidatus Saccharibacteria bacterium]|nr:Arsenical resistance operon repressor [Candidatus Saccharibacteria bacterium]
MDNVNIFKALADKTRLDIVRKLAKSSGTVSGCDIVEDCSSLSQPAMSHHFTKLVDAGVILEQKKGTEKSYELNSALLSSMGIDPSKI